MQVIVGEEGNHRGRLILQNDVSVVVLAIVRAEAAVELSESMHGGVHTEHE